MPDATEGVGIAGGVFAYGGNLNLADEDEA